MNVQAHSVDIVNNSWTTASLPLNVDQTTPFSFPHNNADLSVNLDGGPITTQVATGGTGTGSITYQSSNEEIATVAISSGVVVLKSAGQTMITATRGNEIAQYTLLIKPADPIISSKVIWIRDGGRAVKILNTYASGRSEEITKRIIIESQSGTDCDGDGLLNSNVLVVTNDMGISCTPTNKKYPDLPPLPKQEIARRLQGSVSFSPEYTTDHGSIVDTQREEIPNAYQEIITNQYESGLIEVIDSTSFHESQRAYDYDNDGDMNDFISLTKVYLDQYQYSEHIQVLDSRGESVLEDFGTRTTNATRRINMPDILCEVPSFLRFSGAIDNIVVHIAPTDTEGQYYVKIDNNDPTVQLLVRRNEYDPGISLTSQDLRYDFFDRIPLIDNIRTVSYSIYAVKGDSLYQSPLVQYPNYYVRYDAVNTVVPTLLQKALDDAKNIMIDASLPLLDYYDNVRVEYDGYRSGSFYSGNNIVIGAAHVYAPRPLIHEFAHGYHDNFLPNGFDNEEVKRLYSMVSNQVDMRYGDEGNSYWRVNYLEFFAETLTTYIYIKSGVVIPYFEPISQVDSRFYNDHMVPYFDKLFRVSEASAIDESSDSSVRIYPNPVSSELTLEMPNTDTFTAILYDLSGKVLQTKTGEIKMKMNLYTQKTGSYLLQIRAKNQTVTTKRIFKK